QECKSNQSGEQYSENGSTSRGLDATTARLTQGRSFPLPAILYGDQPMFDGVSGQLGRCMDIEPFHERALMELHSLGRDLEESGNLFHRAPLGDELEHLPLTGGQRARELSHIRPGAAQERTQRLPGYLRRYITAAFQHLVNCVH